MSELKSPLQIRAHNLLCLQGFEGLGYSKEFVAQMRRVARILRMNPDMNIQVITGVDILCEHCPHNYRGRCTADDPEDQPVPMDTPDQATLMDKRVLSWLDIGENDVQFWGQILYKIGRLVDSSAMDILCGDCRWRKYDFCANALDELNRKVTNGELLFPARENSGQD